MRRLLLALAALLSVSAPAAASCTIDFTVTVPRSFVELNVIRDPNRPNDWVPRTLLITLETQRRTGGWQPAELSVQMPPGWEQHGRRVLGNHSVGGNQFRAIFINDRPALTEIMFLRANLQGIGCAADRQFRVRYACTVSQPSYQRLYGRSYPESIRTAVLFNGNRVSPRNITHTLTCPPVG